MFTNESKTGEIVTKLPAASGILKKYKIDFCCGGDVPIGEVFADKNLDGPAILAEIQSCYESSFHSEIKDWSQASYEEILYQVVNKHHAYLNSVLPELSQYVIKVYRVHGDHEPHFEQVYSLFIKLRTDLERHLIKEERDVFPKILEYAQNGNEDALMQANNTIDRLESEHDEAGTILKTLREITNDYTPSADACMTYRLTYKKLEELEEDMFQHVHLENNILFPRLASAVK